MLIIDCPFCGPRQLTEFHYGGEAHIARPSDPKSLSDKEWGDYIFTRTNPKGRHLERWQHRSGCRKWFNAVRNTANDEFEAVYKIGESAPELKPAK
ncbi:MAG: sarcosine oxidase subunit delta [Alphaproteobacteria bacterium]